jgi:hypothetical protein
MRLDAELKLEGEKVILVPYREEHVPKYHDWMADDEILRLTGSDRLTLEQEFDMQRSWSRDPDSTKECDYSLMIIEIADLFMGRKEKN